MKATRQEEERDFFSVVKCAMNLVLVVFYLGQLQEQIRLNFQPDRAVRELRHQVLALPSSSLLRDKALTFMAKGRILDDWTPLSAYRVAEFERIYCLADLPAALSAADVLRAVTAPPRPVAATAAEPRRLRGFDTLIEMGLSAEEVGNMREQFYASQTTDRFISPDELLQMEEDWVNQEVDPDEARRRGTGADGEGDDGLFSPSALIGTDRHLFLGALCGFLFGILIVPVVVLVQAPLKLKVGFTIGLMGNMLYAVAHIALASM